ncbi:MAG TPA: sigma-70 family RNA polymerase sigma factor [Caulobacteraceae bacterium]|nr:sigma-70 family RNA polymerase sigma factor [Caulobacteraceae bacterium]
MTWITFAAFGPSSPEARLVPTDARPEPGPDRDAFADLVERIAAHQDRAAFQALFAWYAPRVKAYLIRLGSEPSAAEELTQEVMVAVWRKASTFDRTQASVSTWLFRIARNRRIDAYRRERRAELDPDEPELSPPAPQAPDEAVMAVDRETRIREALLTLPSEQCELVRRHFYEDLTHSEIAELTGVPLGTVKSRLRLAFAKLRGQLAEGEL